MGRGLGNGVDLGVAVGVGVDCRSRTRCSCGCNCRTRNRRGSHSRGESWRCTGCWCWTGRAHTKHVNKTSDRLLVPLVGCLHAGDEEATFVLVGDYRAASWKLDCAGKNVYCFAEQESIRRQQLHPNNTRIRIGPPDQVNLIDGIERQRGKTSPALRRLSVSGVLLVRRRR